MKNDAGDVPVRLTRLGLLDRAPHLAGEVEFRVSRDEVPVSEQSFHLSRRDVGDAELPLQLLYCTIAARYRYDVRHHDFAPAVPISLVGREELGDVKTESRDNRLTAVLGDLVRAARVIDRVRERGARYK